MKAVIPVAGLGTRMLPATKAIPKEMLPIVDKPLIQYVVEEAVAAGIKDIVLVTHASKNAIGNHFDKSFELEAELEKRVKRQLLDEIRHITDIDVNIMNIRQGEIKGLGHAVLTAYPCIGEETFAVLLPDVLIDQYTCDMKKHNLAQMVSLCEKNHITQVMVEEMPTALLPAYGVVDCQGLTLKPHERAEIVGLIEKPPLDQAPSPYAIVGRYVFTKEIWPLLATTLPGQDGEIQLTDAIAKLIHQVPVEAYHIVGQSFDCGNKLGYMQANMAYALKHADIGTPMRSFTKALVGQQQGVLDIE